MIRTACFAFVAALLAASALAQPPAPTAKPERPLVSVGFGSDFGIFVETPLANPGPQVEAWSWLIRKAPKQIPGGALYDITASRELIQCANWTRKQLYTDGFLGDRHLGRDTTGTEPEPITDGVTKAIANILCGKTDVSKDAPIAEIPAARKLVAAHFAAQ
ncbi:MAG: hypothetical protein EOP61_37990 [Sphingomonadales bacterium]|nr:MAG: hypothetical protein EOP61_37990 [Sphingomonadales bacterium]